MKQIRERWRECFEIERRLGAVARRAIRDVTNKQEARRIVKEITRLFQSLARSLVAQHRQHERERPGGVLDRIGGAELCRHYRRITNPYNYDKMTLKNAATKGVKAWRDRDGRILPTDFGDVVNECLTAFFSACCEDVKYTQSQEYFADFAENNEFEFYENGICIRHR